MFVVDGIHYQSYINVKKTLIYIVPLNTKAIY